LTFSDDEIKERLEKYGTVYLPKEIVETIDDILGNEEIKERLEDFFSSLKKYSEIVEKLKKTKLVPNLTVLLYGPPGTGKTSLTRAYAKKFNIPVCVVESDRLVSALLGDTVKNIRKVVELAANIAEENGAFILFFDEIDAVASERSNVHEVGEIKRAVISFLQIIDKINYFGTPLAIFGATNHQDQLDSAIWRRFTFHLKFDFPDFRLRKAIIESFIKKISDAKIGVDDSILKNLDAEFELINLKAENLKSLMVKDNAIKSLSALWTDKEIIENGGVLYTTKGYTGADLERGIRVALFKALKNDVLTYENFLRSLELVGGTKIHVEQQYYLSATKRMNSNNKNFIKRGKENLQMPREI